MVDNSKEVRKQILSAVGCIAAILTLAVYLAFAIHSAWPFLDEAASYYNVLLVVRVWAPFVVVGITCLEYVSNKNWFIRIVIYAAIALVVIFMFFPGTWDEFVGFVNSKV